MNNIKENNITLIPNLLCYYISNGFYYIVNPNIPNGDRIITEDQKRVLDVLLKEDVSSILVNGSNVTEENTASLLSALNEIKAISSNSSYNQTAILGDPKTLNFWVQTTNECNLRCSYCYIQNLGQETSLKSSNINTFCDSIIKTVVKRELNTVRLRLAGGEPVLKLRIWKDIIPQLNNKLTSLNCKLKVSILSNGLIVNDELLDFILNNHIGVYISLDGISSFHDNTRHFKDGRGSFKMVSDNIIKLMTHGINPSIMTVVSDYNLDGLVDFTKFLIDAKIHARYSFVSGESINKHRLLQVLKDCYNIFDKAIEEGYQFSKLHQLCNLKFNETIPQTCSSGFNGGALFTDGRIYFCQRLFGIDKPLGTIYEDDDLLSIIRRKSYYGNTSIDCQQCFFQNVCKSGCPLDRINNKSPHCDIFKAIIPIIYRLRGKELLYSSILLKKTDHQIPSVR